MRFFFMFGHALSGIVAALKNERNMRIHIAAAVIALFLSWFCGLAAAQFLWVLSAIALVIMAELLNTAVERAVDLISPDRHPLAKVAKDTAAGAVLVASFYALVVGLIIFGRPVLRILLGS